MLKKSSPLKLLGQMEPNLASQVMAISHMTLWVRWAKNRFQGACCHSPEMLGIKMLSFERTWSVYY
jgi:hypothetical protein